MKILVIQQKMIGDVLTTALLFELLREKYPEAELHYLINSHTYPVVKNHPFIDQFIFCTPEIENSKLKFFSFLKTIRKQRFDIVIDVYSIISSALICFFSKAELTIAYHKIYTSFLVSRPIKRLTKPQNNASLAIENRLKLLQPLGIEFKKDVFPKIYLTQKEVETAKAFLKQSHINLDQPLFMISVVGSNTDKTYPKKNMAALLDCIIATNNNVQLLFNYMPKQKEAVQLIYDATHKNTKKNIYADVLGKNLRAFTAITAVCDALIGNEGGANNIAKALNVPTFSIFSPSISKKSWFGNNEVKKHVAVHLSDFIDYDKGKAKQNPKAFYKLFKTEYIRPKLNAFIKKVLS